LGCSASYSSGQATLRPEYCWCSLVYFLYLDRTGYSSAVQWLAGLLVGIIAQSGGFFLHLARGQKNRSSVGTVVTRTRALLLAAALVILAVGLL
jgi:hypothetical protein